MSLAFDAVLVLSYGGPEGPDEVLPFMRNATAGRNIPDARLEEVAEHYYARGGVSPINARNAEFLTALTDELHGRGIDVPIRIGNRNWKPYTTGVLRELRDAGHRRILCLATSAYSSYSGCRQYREDMAAALAGLGTGAVEMDLLKVAPFFTMQGFIDANTDALLAALDGHAAHVTFVTHSIPRGMEQASGPQHDEPWVMSYDAQHRVVAERVARAAEKRLGGPLEWDLAYCSRSGPPQVPWLEPDINDHLAALHAAGTGRVVVAPIGFVSDHMEVVHDLDTEAAATAADLGLDYTRAATVGTHPAFIGALADALALRLTGAGTNPVADGLTPYPDLCGHDCCLPRPGATASAAASQQPTPEGA